MEDDLNGLAALGMWTMAGSLVQASLTDGVVTKTDLARLTLNPARAFALASLLVDVGLWHSPGHECDRCAPVAEGTWLFHDWFDLNYDRGEQVKTTRKKRQELKDKYLIAQVWARDCIDPPKATAGKCRYCGHLVKRADRKSTKRWELDHVDPSLAIGPTNVVLACKECNTTKGQRTPEIAGMTLRPAPKHNAEVDPRATAADPSASRSTSTAETPTADRPTRDADRTRETRSTPTAETRIDVDRREPAADPTAADSEPEHGSSPADQDQIKVISNSISPSHELSSHAGTHARARQGRGGEGGPGVDQGRSGSGQGKPKGKRRRRGGRSRSQPSTAGTPAAQSHPQQGQAGSPPSDIKPPPGQFGSPWHNASPRGKTDELDCPEHGLPAPCRLCVRGES
ncbi:HNH endonuclease [Brevibacterium sp.]|uniref:HNH endonuclease n=1 Tax=Brevibacterium sp. TaxID=1701 RepID=UPI0035C827D1